MSTKPCVIDNCAKVCDTNKGGGRGMCSMHYYRWKRHGSPHKGQTMGRPAGSYKEVDWPYEFKKIDGVWHRRVTGSTAAWDPVVWPERANGVHVQDTGYGL